MRRPLGGLQTAGPGVASVLSKAAAWLGLSLGQGAAPARSPHPQTSPENKLTTLDRVRSWSVRPASVRLLHFRFARARRVNRAFIEQLDSLTRLALTAAQGWCLLTSGAVPAAVTCMRLSVPLHDARDTGIGRRQVHAWLPLVATHGYARARGVRAHAISPRLSPDSLSAAAERA